MIDPTPLEREYAAAADRGDHAEADRLEALIDAEQTARQARLDAPGALAGAALWYAESGIAVFPCRPGAKAPLTRHGFHDATTDPIRVRTWWAATPDANIGLPTGRRFDVIDIDGAAGLIAVHDLIMAGGLPPVLATARTPRGRHYYVPASGQGNRAALLPQVDYRGAGGYVVAPPSRTGDGTYRWMDGAHLDPARLPAHAPKAAA